MTAEAQRLNVEVIQQLFVSPDRQFAVILASEEGTTTLKASGPLAEVFVGQHAVLIGHWKDHPRYGRTFAAQTYEIALPDSRDGLIQFLASDQFKGVGKTLATRIVDHFGDELDHVLSFTPDRLHEEIKGLSRTVAQTIAQTWAQAGILPTVVKRITAVNGPIRAARQIVATYGASSLFQIEQAPYSLIGITGLTWAHIDRLGQAAGIGEDDPQRLACAAQLIVNEVCQRYGHTVVNEEAVEVDLRPMVGGQYSHLAIRHAIAKGKVILVDTGLLAPPSIAKAEDRVAMGIWRTLIKRHGIRAVQPIAMDDHLTPDQVKAVHAVLSGRFSVLTGGPGTGKTTTIRQVVAQAQAADWTIAMCAPTGRAAKRMEELTGVSATTVHRLLEARPDEGGGFIWGRDGENPIEADLIICDEWSMADIHLNEAFFSAVGDGTRVMLVGDADQLPPIGPGAVLRDLGQVEAITLTRLDQVHRQAAESRIITLAHEIKAGTVTPVVDRQHDVFAVTEQTAALAQRVGVIVKERGPAFFGCQPEDIQVLSPMYKGPAGVNHLNSVLRAHLNPDAKTPEPELITPADGGGSEGEGTKGTMPAGGFWRAGDRVVVTKNDPELDVANGDIGTVIDVITKEKIVMVDFPDGERTFEGEQVNTLQAAWALTVHKSQGGEWPVVVLVVDRTHRHMLSKSLLYTAVTRAKKGLIIVGAPEIIGQAALQSNGGLQSRNTRLVERLTQCLDVPF